MSRELVPGETIPVEMFAEEVRRVAHYIADRALVHSGLIPPKVAEILDASAAMLRTAQLHRHYTYADLDKWQKAPENSLDFIDLLESSGL